MSTLEKTVPSEYDGVKIRNYLKEGLNFSSRLISRAAREERIFINDEVVRMNFKVKINLDREENQDIAPEKIYGIHSPGHRPVHQSHRRRKTVTEVRPRR